MVPHIDFELVLAGNYFTDKQKMTDKPNFRWKITDEVMSE